MNEKHPISEKDRNIDCQARKEKGKRELARKQRNQQMQRAKSFDQCSWNHASFKMKE